MTKLEVVRAWKDEEYRSSLSEAEQELIPQNPAGFVALSDDDLSSAKGAALGSCYACFSCKTMDCDNTATVTETTPTLNLSPA